MTRWLVILILCASALGQKKAKKPEVPVLPAPAAVDSSIKIDYTLPQAEHARIRDLQHRDDQLEIQVQKLLVQITELRGQQALAVEGEKLIVWQFAQDHKIDLTKYALDPAEIKLVEKK